MSRRIAGWTTVMLAALCPALCRAQSYDPQMPPPISATGYGMPYGGGYAPYAGGYGGYPDPAAGAYNGGYAPPAGNWTRYTQMPDDTGWAYGDTELDKMITNIFRHAFFRLEYLNWSMTDPGNTVLGEPGLDLNASVPTINDPHAIFDVFDPVTGALIGQGFQPTLGGVHLHNNNGIRGTWGFNFEPFKLEASVFALQSAHSSVLSTSLPIQRQADATDIVAPDPLYVGTGLLVNGAPSSTVLVYNSGYHASMQTAVWGSDLKFVMTPYDAGSPLQIQPVYGLKFLSFTERLFQTGLSTDSSDNVIAGQINSATRNYLYGPQVGVRVELVSKFLTLGVEPKIMLGANSYSAGLNTNGLLGSTDTGQSLHESKTTFGAVADFQTYAKGQISEHLSVFVAFNLMWAGGVTRPYENIVYNVNTTGTTSLFQQDVHFTDLLLYGVSVGGQVEW